MEIIEKHASFGGSQEVYRHQSIALNCSMKFSIYLPPHDKDEKLPVLYWLSGLTCNEQTIEKKQRLLDLGVKDVIASEDEPDLYEALVSRLGGEHLDVAFDAVGGPHIEQIAKAMSVGGTMVMHGALSPEITPFPLKVALRKSLTMRGFLFLEVLHDPVLREQARRFILSSIGAGYLRPVIDRCFNFEDMHDAQRYLESNQQIGKIVVTLGRVEHSQIGTADC